MSYNDIRLLHPDTFVGLSSLIILVITDSKVRKILAGSFRHRQDLTELQVSINNTQTLQPGVLELAGKFRRSSSTVQRHNHPQRRSVWTFVCGAHRQSKPICNKAITRSERFPTQFNLQHVTGTHKTTTFRSTLNNIIHIHPNTFIHNIHLLYLLLRGNQIFTLAINFLYIPSLWKLDISKCEMSQVTPNRIFPVCARSIGTGYILQQNRVHKCGFTKTNRRSGNSIFVR